MSANPPAAAARDFSVVILNQSRRGPPSHFAPPSHGLTEATHADLMASVCWTLCRLLEAVLIRSHPVCYLVQQQCVLFVALNRCVNETWWVMHQTFVAIIKEATFNMSGTRTRLGAFILIAPGTHLKRSCCFSPTRRHQMVASQLDYSGSLRACRQHEKRHRRAAVGGAPSCAETCRHYTNFYTKEGSAAGGHSSALQQGH